MAARCELRRKRKNRPCPRSKGALQSGFAQSDNMAYSSFSPDGIDSNRNYRGSTEESNALNLSAQFAISIGLAAWAVDWGSDMTAGRARFGPSQKFAGRLCRICCLLRALHRQAFQIRQEAGQQAYRRQHRADQINESNAG